MRERRGARALPLAGTAAAGVVLGHWLAYLAAVPDAHHRGAVLAAAGHGYWDLAIRAALVLGLTGLGARLLSHLRTGLRGEELTEGSPVRLAASLAVLQTAGFVAMEVTERVAAGAPLSGMLQHHLLLSGIAVQVLVAVAGALVLGWFARAAHHLGAAVRRSRPAATPARFDPPGRPAFLRAPAPLGGRGQRSPPLPA